MRMARGRATYSTGVAVLRPDGTAAAGEEARPELADVTRLGRRLVRHAVHLARAEESSIRHLLISHLGDGAEAMPVLSASWQRYDHVNVQAGLDAWLAAGGREHEIVGLTGFRHSEFGLADLLQPSPWMHHVGKGSVTTVTLPSGPDGATRACVQCAIYLVREEAGPLALVLRGPDDRGLTEGVLVEVVSASQEQSQRAVDGIRRLALERNVYRGQVVAFGGDVFGPGGALLNFRPRPRVSREQVVLPDDVLDGIERQVLGVARHSGRLLASGQHLKRGVLLHGAPGTGKTHTIRYLLSKLSGVTAVVLSGGALGLIAEACSVARTLQPSLVVVEDVDLIAEEREFGSGDHPLLFELLNEMDGLGEDLDVTFLLTTNRADLLEPALAQRPGRVDHAALLPLPDAEARQRLLGLYRGNLVLDLSSPREVISRTEGVTASFMKELLRRAALRAAGEPGEETGPLTVTDAHVSAALDELLDTRNALTRVLLGGQPPAASASAAE